MRGERINRDRILEVAERLFAEKGYSGATVREITREARCNLAAVNYYFGSKKNLYLTVFKERLLPRAKIIKETFYQILNQQKEKTPENIIKAFARAFFSGPIPHEERIISHRLIAREMNQPSEAFEMLVKEMFLPFFKEFVELLSPFFPEKSPQDLCLSLLSIHAQVLYFNFNRIVMEILCEQKFDEKFLEKIIHHIVSFSLYGIRGKK
jgi:AcrR family transcriptional regulator